MNWIARVVCAVLFLQVAGLCYAETMNSVEIVTENFPPYSYLEGETPKGLSVEVVQAVLDEAGFTGEFNFLPWARAYQKAVRGDNVLIFSIARIPEREDSFRWVGEIAPYRTSLYKLAERELDVTDLDDARQYRIGVSQQDVIYTYLMSRGFNQLDIIGTDALNIQKLKYGRFPLMAYDEASFVYALKQQGEAAKDFEQVLSIDDLSGSLYMAFGKNSDAALVERFRVALASIKASGRYQAILDRYFDAVYVSQ